MSMAATLRGHSHGGRGGGGESWYSYNRGAIAHAARLSNTFAEGGEWGSESRLHNRELKDPVA